MKRYVLTCAAAIVCAGTIAMAQTPAEQPRQTEPRQPATTADQAATTTLVGCLYNEKDIPGRRPNVAERAGIMEDYILVEGSPSSQPGSTASPSGSTSGATGTSGTASSSHKMYKVEQIADERLRALVGKRVEVIGRIDQEAGDTKGTSGTATAERDKNLGPDKIELPEFEATSIREVPGTCPSKPSGSVR